MFVATSCPSCQRPLRLRVASAGQRLRCPGCGTGFVVSLSAPGAAPATAEPGAEAVPRLAPPAEATRAPSQALGRDGTALAVLLPLGLPLLTRGGALGFGLGAGLAALTLLLA